MLEQTETRDTVAELAADWLNLYVRTARTPGNAAMTAQRLRDYLFPFMGDRSVQALHQNDCRAYRLWLEKSGRLAPRTVRHLLTDLRCFLYWLVETEVLVRSPMPRRLMPKIQESLPDRLTDYEVRRVLDIPEPHAFAVRLALGTGLRWGELVRVRAADVHNGMLEISKTKSGRVRRIPLDADLAAEIAARGAGGRRLVEYSELGGPGPFNAFVRRNSRVARFHVHQLRHTFACRWIARGGSLPSLQQVLGHASVVTTQHYAKLSDDSVRREAERISGFGLKDWLKPDRNLPDNGVL